MHCLDIVRRIVSPRAAHALRVLVVRHDVVVVGELLVADAAPAALLCKGAREMIPIETGF